MAVLNDDINNLKKQKQLIDDKLNKLEPLYFRIHQYSTEDRESLFHIYRTNIYISNMDMADAADEFIESLNFKLKGDFNFSLIPYITATNQYIYTVDTNVHSSFLITLYDEGYFDIFNLQEIVLKKAEEVEDFDIKEFFSCLEDEYFNMKF